MATRAEQTLYRGTSKESVQTAIDAIPLDFHLASSPYPLRTPTGEWDVLGAFESVRKITAGFALKDVHVSLVSLGRDDKENVYIWSAGDHISVYRRDGALPESAHNPDTTGQVSFNNQVKAV